MTIFEYKCPDHPSVRVDSTTHANPLPNTYCDFCQSFRDFKRVFSIAIRPSMQEHFNQSVGKPISNMRQYRDELHRKSDELARDQIMHTVDGEPIRVPGIETNYQPLEWGDHAAFGVTNEGIHESNSMRSKMGMPLLPEIG